MICNVDPTWKKEFLEYAATDGFDGGLKQELLNHKTGDNTKFLLHYLDEDDMLGDFKIGFSEVDGDYQELYNIYCPCNEPTLDLFLDKEAHKLGHLEVVRRIAAVFSEILQAEVLLEEWEKEE